MDKNWELVQKKVTVLRWRAACVCNVCRVCTRARAYRDGLSFALHERERVGATRFFSLFFWLAARVALCEILIIRVCGACACGLLLAVCCACAYYAWTRL